MKMCVRTHAESGSAVWSYCHPRKPSQLDVRLGCWTTPGMSSQSWNNSSVANPLEAHIVADRRHRSLHASESGVFVRYQDTR